MIILLCGRDKCGLNAHSVDPDSMRIESWSSVDRPLIILISSCAFIVVFGVYDVCVHDVCNKEVLMP